jgi:hypothetical protein
MDSVTQTIKPATAPLKASIGVSRVNANHGFCHPNLKPCHRTTEGSTGAKHSRGYDSTNAVRSVRDSVARCGDHKCIVLSGTVIGLSDRLSDRFARGLLLGFPMLLGLKLVYM